jgi:hypothetical protein
MAKPESEDYTPLEVARALYAWEYSTSAIEKIEAVYGPDGLAQWAGVWQDGPLFAGDLPPGATPEGLTVPLHPGGPYP